MATACVFLAYLDPGTGSLILQALLAILLSTGVLLRRFILMPFQWLLSKTRRQPAESSDLFE